MQSAHNDRFISYVRVSTARQGASGLGLDAQRSAVNAYISSQAGNRGVSAPSRRSHKETAPGALSTVTRSPAVWTPPSCSLNPWAGRRLCGGAPMRRQSLMVVPGRRS